MTQRFELRAFVVLCLGFLCVAGAGCGREEPHATTTAKAPPTPEQSFAEIVRVVSKALDTGEGGIPSGFVASDPSSRTQFVVKNEVGSKLIPPGTPGETYRGTITVTSHSIYSYRHSEGAPVENGEGSSTKNSNGGGFNLLNDSNAEDGGIGDSNDGLISEAPSPKPDAAAEPGESVNRRSDDDVSTFDLAYENGRWVLKTDPDPKTEMTVKKAFDYALEQQL